MVTKGNGGPAPTKDIKFAPRNVAKGEVHAMEAMLRAGNAPPSQLAITPEMLGKLAAMLDAGVMRKMGVEAEVQPNNLNKSFEGSSNG